MKVKEMVVCKFGGSSVQNPTQIKKVCEIIKSDSARKVVVVSAPGRDEFYNEKITDHLLNYATCGRHFSEQAIEITQEQSYKAIIEKFEYLCDGLKIKKEPIIDSLISDLKNCTLEALKKRHICSQEESIIMPNSLSNISNLKGLKSNYNCLKPLDLY
jgi:aspartate kinase